MSLHTVKGHDITFIRHACPVTRLVTSQGRAGSSLAATLCAQASTAAVAASAADQSCITDPSLDSLIDRWLSHKHASTSAATNGSSNSRSKQQELQQQVFAGWESVLGPVAVSMTSLATLEEGDELFVLRDALGHLGGSLQELQALAAQLLQRQRQLEQAEEAGAAAEYTQQLTQLLVTAAEQVSGLDDAGIINLLATATVLLTSPISSAAAAAAAGEDADSLASSSSSSSYGEQAAVHAAAVAAMRATCTELWQRPQVAAGCDAAALTSLAVVLRRLSKLGISSSSLPPLLPASAYQQLQQLASAGELTLSQLAVCCWCLSSLKVPPPAAAVAAALQAATTAATTAASSNDGPEVLALRQLSAACINWSGYAAAQRDGNIGTDGAGSGGSAVVAATAFLQQAAQCVMQLDDPPGHSSSSRRRSKSSNSAETVCRAAAAVAQAAAAYHVYPGDRFVQMVVRQLLQGAESCASEPARDVDSSSSRQLAAAATAAGYLTPWWGALDSGLQEQLLQAVSSFSHLQQRCEAVATQHQQPAPWLQSYLLGVDCSCQGLQGTPGRVAAHTDVWSCLEALTQLVLRDAGGQPSGSRETGSSSSSSSSSSPVGYSACLSSLLRALTATNCHSPALLQLSAAAAATYQSCCDERLEGGAVMAAAAQAAADAVVALCRSQPQGWQEGLQQLAGLLRQRPDSWLQPLPLSAAVQVHAAAAAASQTCPAAAELCAAALRHLLQPRVLDSTTAVQAADLLLQLTAGPAPARVVVGQQLCVVLPAGLQDLIHSSSSSSSSSSSYGERDPVDDLQQQSLRCLGIIARDGLQALLPGQVVPLLAALAFLQKQHQQDSWFCGPALPAYAQLHREVLSAVVLQLQDCTSWLTPSDLSLSVRLMVLMQARPSLALTSVVTAAVSCAAQFRQHDLVWLLWGLTKLHFTGGRRLQQQLLTAALQRASAPAGVSSASTVSAANQQHYGTDAAAAAPDGAETAGNEIAGSDGSAGRAAAVGAAGVEFDSAVALLWVAASRGRVDSAVLQLLAQVVEQPMVPSLRQAASVLWSYARLVQLGLVQQPQQQQAVVAMVEQALSGGTAAADLRARDVAVLMLGLHRLGTVPSSAAQAVLVEGALQLTAADQEDELASGSVSFLPGEFSCFLYCLTHWGVSLQPQQLDQLEVFLQQQLLHEVAQDAFPAAVDNRNSNGSNGNTGSSSSSRTQRVRWDGLAVCRACWSLYRLGAKLQHSTLSAAEQCLVRLLPATHTAAAAQSTIDGQRRLRELPQQQGTQRQPWHDVPAASDLLLFGTASRASGYQPVQLLRAVRSWLLLKLAAKGAAGLLALSPGGGRQSPAAASLPRSSDAAAAAVPSTGLQQQQQQQQQLPKDQGSTPLNAHILVSVMLFLRQTRFGDRALLQQLELLSTQRPVFVQLTAWQLVLLLGSFRQLGYVPRRWFSKGCLRCITRHVLDVHTAGGSGTAADARPGFSAQDCVELLECLAAWHAEPELSSNTGLWQYILPGLTQLLLGLQHRQPNTLPLAPASATAGGGSLPSSSTAGSNSSSSSGRSSVDGLPASSAAAAAAASGSTTSANGGNSTGTNLVAGMPGWQVVSLLHSMLALGLLQRGKLYQRLLQVLLRRLQQTWPDLDVCTQVAAAHVAGRLGHDFTTLIHLPALMAHQQTTTAPPPPQPQQQLDASPTAAADVRAGPPVMTAQEASRLLWVYGNVGRHPGPQLLTVTLSSVASAAQEAEQEGVLLPLREVSTALYAACVLQELHHPAATALQQLLQTAADSRQLLSHPQFTQQSEQLAACWLAERDAAKAGSPAPPAAPAGDGGEQGVGASAAAGPAGGGSPGGAGGAGVMRPLLALPADVQGRLQEAWRRKVLQKASKRQGMGDHMQLLLTLRQLGLRGRAKALTDDGCACIDVAVTTSRGDRLAVELLGPHNAAVNTQRPLAPARLKWRMLARRGYKVVVINSWQWRALDTGGLASRSKDGGGSSSSSSSRSASGVESSVEEYESGVMSERLLYLQARLQAALGPAAGALRGANRGARPLPQQLVLDRWSRGSVPGQQAKT